MAVRKAAELFSKAFAEEVQRWGVMKQTGVSLRYMMEFGARPTEKNLLISAQFLHKELPIRIARRAIELESLPSGLSEKPAVLKVYDMFHLDGLIFFVCFWVILVLKGVEDLGFRWRPGFCFLFFVFLKFVQ